MNRLGETDGSAGGRNPFGYDDDINQAANEIALATDCLYRIEVMDIVAGQSDYCAPPLYKTVGATVYDAQAAPHGLAGLSPWQTFPAGGYSNGASASGVPCFFIDLGAGAIRLVPSPSYNSAAAVLTDLVVGANPFQVSSALSPFLPGTTGFLQVEDFQVAAASGGLGGFVTLSGILPDASSAAFTLTENGAVYPSSGAFPATLTTSGGVSTLLPASGISLPSGLAAGQVSVQPGNLVGGVFTPVGTSVSVTLSAGAFAAGRYQILGVDTLGNATLSRSPGPSGASGGAATLTTGGLSVEGYAVPDNSWSAPSDPCPLPLSAHVAVAARAAWMRCLSFPSAENAARMPGLDQIYKYAKGQLEGAVARQTDAAAARDGQMLSFGPATSPTDIGNPLEL